PAATSDCATLSLHDALPIYFLEVLVVVTTELRRKKPRILGDLIVTKSIRKLVPLMRQYGYSDISERPTFEDAGGPAVRVLRARSDRKSTRLNFSHVKISYAV